jgi:hypothetical protein
LRALKADDPKAGSGALPFNFRLKNNYDGVEVRKFRWVPLSLPEVLIILDWEKTPDMI